MTHGRRIWESRDCLSAVFGPVHLIMPTLHENEGNNKDSTEPGVDRVDRQSQTGGTTLASTAEEPHHPAHRTMARDVAKLRSDGVRKFSILNSRETRDRVQLANQVVSWGPSGPLFLCW